VKILIVLIMDLKLQFSLMLIVYLGNQLVLIQDLQPALIKHVQLVIIVIPHVIHG